MPIRFLDKIDLAIASASTSDDMRRLLAKKATYLAKVGSFAEADEIIRSLRRHINVYENVELSVHLTFFDGIVAFYLDRIDEARDRFTRSSVLSKAVDVRQIAALSSAWLAHLAFGRFDFDCLAKEIGVAFDFVGKSDHDCLARVCLVIAQTIHLAGRHDVAAGWYARARIHAVELGDESTISSLMYNRTAMEIVNCRQSLLWRGEVGDARFAVSSAEATDNFDRLVGVVSLGEFTPLLKAQTYSLAGRFAEAEDIYSASLVDNPSKAQERSQCWLLADRAYCLTRLGFIERALMVAESSVEHMSSLVQIDDLAATHGRLAAIFLESGDRRRAQAHLDESGRLWVQFSSLQESILRQASAYEGRYVSIKNPSGTSSHGAAN